MVIEQSVICPYCKGEIASHIELTPTQMEAEETCTDCRRTIYYRIHRDGHGGIEGIEIRRQN